NLVTTPEDAATFGGLGGWELDELVPRTDLNTPIGASVPVSLSNGLRVTFCNVATAGTTFSSTVPNPYDPSQHFPKLFDPFHLNGPMLPPNVASPTTLSLLWTSALWGQGCNPLAAASVAAPVPAGVMNPRLLQIQWDGAQSTWKDITTSVD